MPSCLQPIKYNGFLLSYPIFAAGQDLWYLRLVIKKAMKIWYCILPDYGLLTGFSIVTVHHGPERIHSGFWIFYQPFHTVCTRWIMKEPASLCHIWCVCVLHTLRIDSFLLRELPMYNIITIVYWILRQLILWTFYTPESYIYTLGIGIYTPRTEYPLPYQQTLAASPCKSKLKANCIITIL